jgi:hypothetical protein
VLADAGTTVVKIPSRWPGRTASPERFALTVLTEVTDRMLIFSERHLQGARRYAAHDNKRRPHRASHLRPPWPQTLRRDPASGGSRRRPVRGGLINEYEPAA